MNAEKLVRGLWLAISTAAQLAVWLAIAAAALFVALPAAAKCDRYEVAVAPLEVAYEDKSYAELGDRVGAVFATRHFRVDGCKVTVGYRNVVLSVARELHSNRCLYNHVREHEERHLAIYRDELTRLAPRLAAEAQVMSVEKAAEAAFDAIRAEHAAFDTDDEYARNSRVCRRAMASLIAVR